MNKKVLFTIAPAALLMGALVGCKGGSTETNVLAVSGLESNYYVGDKLDTSKLVVNSIDKDGKATAVAAENLEYSFTDAFTEVGSKTITVKDKKTNAKGAFVVTVLNASEVSKEKYISTIFDCIYKKNIKFDVDTTFYSWNEEKQIYDESKLISIYKRYDGIQESYTNNGNIRYLYHVTDPKVVESTGGDFCYVYPAVNTEGVTEWIYNGDWNAVPGTEGELASIFYTNLLSYFDDLYDFDKFAYKDGVYNYVKNVSDVLWSGEPGYINYNLTFNKGKISKIESMMVRTPKEKSNAEEIPVKKIIIDVDFNYNEQILTAPSSADKTLKTCSANTITSTLEGTTRKVIFTDFTNPSGGAATDFTYLQKENLKVDIHNSDYSVPQIKSIDVVEVDSKKAVQVLIDNNQLSADGWSFNLVLCNMAVGYCDQDV